MNSVCTICFRVCGGMSHGCQLFYRWPGTLPWLVSLSLSLIIQPSLMIGRQHTPITQLSWLPVQVLLASWQVKSPLNAVLLFNWTKVVGWLADWLLHADCESKKQVELEMFGANMLLKCLKCDWMHVFACPCCPYKKTFYGHGFGQKKVQLTLKLHRRSKMESSVWIRITVLAVGVNIGT